MVAKKKVAKKKVAKKVAKKKVAKKRKQLAITFLKLKSSASPTTEDFSLLKYRVII